MSIIGMKCPLTTSFVKNQNPNLADNNLEFFRFWKTKFFRMSDESDNYPLSDEDINDKRHEKLVDDILNLNKIQNLKRPSRTEPSLHVSEFGLVKSATSNKGSVYINELTKVLKGYKKHEKTSKKAQLTSNKSKTLPTPLEKPQADRIKRSVSYEKARLQLDRWEALVTSNRAAAHLQFPLDSMEKIKTIEKEAEHYPSMWRLKSELQQKLEKVESKVEEYHINTEDKDKFPLTLEELKEHRKEAAKLRAHQSYKEAKARQQNKIKSKKYHRILRREKIKQKLKEFEELQKTNPEEALRKLEDIEKARAEERFSLRHKGTGQWARNKQIRAKYDKESRQVLAQQLAISRELTQKVQSKQSDSEDEGIESEGNSKPNKVDSGNPWVAGIKPNKEVVDFVSGYRKYWNERNNELNKNTENNETTESTQVGEENGKERAETEVVSEVLQTDKTINTPKLKKHSKHSTNLKKQKKTFLKKSKIGVKATISTSISTSNWKVSSLDEKIDGNDIDNLFDGLEEKLQKRLKQKYNKVKRNNSNKISKEKTKKGNKCLKKEKKKIDLAMLSTSKKHIIDEELIEKSKNADNELIDKNAKSNLSTIKDILNTAEQKENAPDIDPNKFVEIKKTNLNTAVPDISLTDENEENNSQRHIILEAFEDDDIAEDFAKEKAEEVEKNNPKDIDLNLPGWGSWGGANINPSKRKRKRFIIKMPPKMPRKDENKGSLIINENAQSKIKTHMVSELPFPFKTVKDYEASIRAPIGNTFVPETAFRKLIEPAVTTKMGAIIEPISRSILVGEKKV